MAHKKFFTLFSMISLVAFLMGVEPTHADDRTIIVGFPEDNMANDWRAAQARELAEALKAHPNIRFLEADAKGKVAQNIQDIEDMVTAGAELLFLGPRNAKLITPIVEKLHRDGIHIVLLTRRIESESFDTFISPNDFNIARAAAIHLSTHLGGKGTVLMLEGVPSATTAIRRSAGFRDGLSKAPGVKLAATIPGNYSRTGGLKAISEALEKGLQFDAIFSHNDAMLVGARLALRTAGIDPATIPSIGIDYSREARNAIRNGEQTASFTYPTCGKEGARSAVAILKGESVEKYIDVPSVLVTKENVHRISTVF